MKRLAIIALLLLGCRSQVIYDCTEIEPEKQEAFDTRFAECSEMTATGPCIENLKQTYCKPVTVTRPSK